MPTAATIPRSNRFLCYLGDETQFAVPDTGTPGAVVHHVRPDGTRELLEVTCEPCAPIPASAARPGQPAIVARLGIRTRRGYKQVGVHRFEIDQDGTETVYEFTVLAPAAHGNAADEARLAAERRAWRRSLVDVPDTNELTPAFHPAAKAKK